jgi:glycine oxidase
MVHAPDVLVIGGGVVGCAVARAAAGAGLTVLLAERGALGGEASSAAAGVLAVACGDDLEGPRLELRRASLALFDALAAELGEETGVDVELDRSGVLELALAEDDDARAAERQRRRRAQGFAVEWLDAAHLRDAEPRAQPSARGALLFAGDAHVNPGRLVEALAAAARRRGAELLTGAEVRGVERDGGRIARVRVGGEWVAPGTVVLAAGAWAARVPGVAPRLPVEPARGQMLALRPATPLCRRVLSYGDAYLVARRNGEVVVGATVEHAGFVKAVTPAGVSALLAKIATLAPAGLEAPVTRLWCGLRPYVPDGGPIIGRAPGTANLVLACGHHRNGVLLAPITAAAVVAQLTGARPPVDLGPFLPPSGARA